MKEYRGFQVMKALAVVKLPKGARIHGTLTRWLYKEENSKLVKYKVRMGGSAGGRRKFSCH
jgi:hypothetical protein